MRKERKFTFCHKLIYKFFFLCFLPTLAAVSRIVFWHIFSLICEQIPDMSEGKLSYHHPRQWRINRCERHLLYIFIFGPHLMWLRYLMNKDIHIFRSLKCSKYVTFCPYLFSKWVEGIQLTWESRSYSRSLGHCTSTTIFDPYSGSWFKLTFKLPTWQTGKEREGVWVKFWMNWNIAYHAFKLLKGGNSFGQ